jgi:hypothetical protein
MDCQHLPREVWWTDMGGIHRVAQLTMNGNWIAVVSPGLLVQLKHCPGCDTKLWGLRSEHK